MDGGEAMTVEHYRFKDNLREDMEAADLIISHGGRLSSTT